MTSATLILRSIARNKVRTILVCLSISIAFLLYGLLFGFNHALNHGEESAANELLVHNAANLMIGLPVSHGERIAGVEGVEGVTSATLIGSYYQETSRPVPLLMVDVPSHLRIFGPDIELIDGDLSNFLSRRDGLLVHEDIARQFGWRASDDVPLFSSLYMFSDFEMLWPFEIIAIFRTKPGAPPIPFALGHLDYLREASPNWNGRVHWYLLRTLDPAANDEVAARLDARFANSEAATRTQSADMMARAFFAQVGNVSMLIRIIVGSAFVTILLIAGNTMALAVRRRTHEIGIMCVLGFPRSHIFRWIIGESLAVATLGGLAGLVGAAAIMPAMTAALDADGEARVLDLPLPVLVTGLGLIAVVGVVTGILPAVRAIRLVPAEALKRPS